MFCVAGVMLAYGFGINIAMSLFFKSRTEKMQEDMRRCMFSTKFYFLSKMDCICFV